MKSITLEPHVCREYEDGGPRRTQINNEMSRLAEAIGEDVEIRSFDGIVLAVRCVPQDILYP